MTKDKVPMSKNFSGYSRTEEAKAYIKRGRKTNAEPTTHGFRNLVESCVEIEPAVFLGWPSARVPLGRREHLQIVKTLRA